MIRNVLLAMGVVLLAGCGNGDDNRTAAPAATVYQVTGVVQRLEMAKNKVIIDHAEIPDYMPAMIMPFRVKDPALLDGLDPGDEIRFDFHVTPDRSWIGSIAKTGRKVAVTEVQPEQPDAKLLKVGDEMADFRFTDENGDRVSLHDFRGKVVAFTFIFTRCPVPEYCPALMSKFAQVNMALNSDPTVTDWQLLSISFDYWNDTPAILKAYRDAYNKTESDDMGRWRMLRGASPEVVEGIGRSVGLKFGEQKGTYEHNLRTVVLNKDGRVTQIFTDEIWTTDDLLGAIRQAGE
jgi:protein SCO1/2